MRHFRSLLALVWVACLSAEREFAVAETAPSSKAELVTAIDAIAADAMKDGRVAALSIAVEKEGEAILLKGYGAVDLENDIPATEHTVYRLGSITKQFTAIAILQLIEQGKLSLDDEITKFIPDYPTQGHKVTIHHLLNHTSGIKNYTNLGPKFREKMRKDVKHEEMIALFGPEPFDFNPGEKFSYTNSGYYLLGVIVEKVSGESYEEYLKDNVFKPAGLEETYYLSERPLVKHRARGYVRVAGGKLVNCDPMSMTVPFAAGSLGSTVADLLKWQRALNENKLISKESHEKMTTPGELAGGAKMTYAYGLVVGRLSGEPFIGHGGGINGFQTELDYYPQRRLTIAVLANTEGANPGRIAKQIARKVMNLPEEEAKNLPLTSEQMEPFVGKYEVSGQTAYIYKTSAGLMIRLPGLGENFRLLNQGEGVFSADGNPDRRFTFRVDGSKANSVQVQSGPNKMEGKRVE